MSPTSYPHATKAGRNAGELALDVRVLGELSKRCDWENWLSLVCQVVA